ncbi:MAG TPA: hypothetical protein VNM90_18605, partial [Haliangium sp.]|nr:hypothetical protein [Haliangium sp.]
MSFNHAGALLAAGGASEVEIVESLVRARELFRATSPEHATMAGIMLGAFQRRLGHHDASIAAYRTA